MRKDQARIPGTNPYPGLVKKRLVKKRLVKKQGSLELRYNERLVSLRKEHGLVKAAELRFAHRADSGGRS